MLLENCTLKNRCLTSNLIYEADVENNANKGTKIYFSLTITFFKMQLQNHKKDFNRKQNRKSIELSKYALSLKKEQIMSRIRLSIIRNVYGKTKINFCPLCLAEKVHLTEHVNDNGFKGTYLLVDVGIK